MCTILVVHQRHDEYPTIVAANRDEFHARPAEPPHVLSDVPRVVAGLDLEKGGTWMGATGDGAFVALTNQRSWDGPNPKLQSRGEVALAMLQAGELGGMRDVLEGLDPAHFNPFNVLFGDAQALFVAYARPDETRVVPQPLEPGVHVLVNDRMGSPEFPKSDRARALVEPHVREPWPALQQALARMLADHAKPPMEALADPPPHSPWPKEGLVELQALCTHAGPYGTRSSSIVALAPGAVAHYLHAEGPPCRTAFGDITGLFA
jgi:uncharacterized protein with NRDE domain